MLIEFNKNHFEVTEGLKEATINKLEPLKRHFDKITRIHVGFHIEGTQHRAEATLHVPGRDLHVEESSPKDMYAAIDLLAHTLDRQLVKHKEKLKNHRPHHNAGRTERLSEEMKPDEE